MVTRNDVARLAGTSTAVVSYVVNNGPRPVSAATRQRVEEVMKELGYRPNGIARALRSQRSHVLGVVVPDSSNPFFAELAREIEQEASRRGYFIMLGNSAGEDVRESGYVQALLDRQVDGLVLVSASQRRQLHAETRRALVNASIPVVLVDRQHQVKGASVLLVDNRQGASLATRHLLGVHGLRRIACLAGPKDLGVSQQRVTGWEEELRSAGVVPAASWLLHSDFDRDDAFRVAYAWLGSVGRQLGRRPQGLFACSDEQAMGVLRAARARGVRIPEDLALASFDGTPEADYTSPGLTTVCQPLADIGRRAVDLLLHAPPRPRCRVELFPAELAVRGSCGCRDRSILP